MALAHATCGRFASGVGAVHARRSQSRRADGQCVSKLCCLAPSVRSHAAPALQRPNDESQSHMPTFTPQAVDSCSPRTVDAQTWGWNRVGRLHACDALRIPQHITQHVSTHAAHSRCRPTDLDSGGMPSNAGRAPWVAESVSRPCRASSRREGVEVRLFLPFAIAEDAVSAQPQSQMEGER